MLRNPCFVYLVHHVCNIICRLIMKYPYSLHQLIFNWSPLSISVSVCLSVTLMINLIKSVCMFICTGYPYQFRAFGAKDQSNHVALVT